MSERQRKRLLDFGLLALCVSVCCIVAMLWGNGCAAGKYNAAKTHQTVTMVIADAGTVAIQAEQAYQAGTIPKTEAARKTINDLGSAYNTAKDVYGDLLTAEAVYNGAQQQQLGACAPGAAATDPCKAATARVAAAKTTLDTQAAKFNSTLGELAAKTAAVKSLQTKP